MASETQGIPARVAQGFISEQVVLGGREGFDLDHDPARVPQIPLDHLIITEMDEPFDLSGFERPREPLLVGYGDLSNVPYPIDVHNMPIKFPNTQYRVPGELGYLEDILTTCASVERTVNPNHDDYYAYLSLERSLVEAGQSQRTPVVHSDGLQGPRVQPKVRTEHMYQITDAFPPRFFVHPFDMSGLDVDAHDLDQVFPSQSRHEDTVSFNPGDIALFDSYCLHQANVAPEDVVRGFFRLTYADPRRQFNRQGNTINTLFEEEYRSEGWEFQIRDKLNLASPPES